MKVYAVVFWLCMLLAHLGVAQSTFVPLNEDYYHRLDRYEVRAGGIFPQVFTGVKQYKRSDIVDFVDSVNAAGGFVSRSDKFNAAFFANDSWEWSGAESANGVRPVLKRFYKKKSDLYHAQTQDFDLHINPVLYVGGGKDSRMDDALFVNTRGVELRGMVDKKVGFYTYLTDNQALLPSYVDDQLRSTLVIPHEGFWKDYKNGKGVDFLQARGYISFEATKHINLQVGHDRFFVGHGIRSLGLSDNAPPAFFLKGNVKVWKLNYFFLLNRFTADVVGNRSGLSSARRYPDKFMAFHHFSINVGKRLNIGVFESVIFRSDDSTRQGRFDMAYANPIIFYRAIEQQNGSSDNVLLGADFKWYPFKKVQLYGQLTLDEFLLENLKQGNGWWANKFAVQAGLKYVDVFGVSNLDIQGEINIARPYTYSHGTIYTSYSSYRQPIAHPLGANFKEVIGVLRYQPVPRLNLVGKLMMAQVGRDTVGVNWGGDILKLNITKQQIFGNTIGQGVKNDVLYGSFTASWMIKHNLFFDASMIIRQSKSPVAIYNNNSTITSIALRWNIAQRHYDF